MVVPSAELPLFTPIGGAQYLGIFVGKPRGAGAAGSGKDHLSSCRIDIIQRLVQKGKVKPSLLGLQCRPGKDAHAHFIAVSKPEQAHIFLQHLGLVLPLVGIIVAAVEHVADVSKNILFHSDPP